MLLQIFTKKTHLFVAGLLLLSFAATAQAPSLLWSISDWSAYIGTKRSMFTEVHPTADGGFIAVGAVNATTAATGEDAWIVKTDAAGNVSWQYAMGGSARDIFTTVLPTSDGGYLAGGFTASSDRDVTGHHGGNDIWLVKFNDTGAVEWKQCYGGSMSDMISTSFSSFFTKDALIRETADGGFVIAGSSNSSDGDVSGFHGSSSVTATSIRGDIWLFKINATGTIVWEHCIGGSLNEWPSSLIPTGDNGFLIGAVTSSSNGDATNSGYHGGRSTLIEGGDLWVIKTDSAGTVRWQKCYGGSGVELLSGMIKDHDGNYVLAGHSASSDGDISNPPAGLLSGLNPKPWLVKIDSTGNLIWEHFLYLDSVNAGGEYITSIVPSIDGSYCMAYSQAGQFYKGFIKADSAQNLIWKSEDLQLTENAALVQIKQLSDGGFIGIGGSPTVSISTAGSTPEYKAYIARFSGCPTYTYQEATICKGDNYTFGGSSYTTPGIYWDSLTDVGGCDSLIRLTLRVNSITQPEIIATGQVLSTGSYSSYQWLDGNNNPISGANDRNYETGVAGHYRVIVTGTNGCSDTSATFNHTPASIPEAALFSQLNVYPNPANDMVSIAIPGFTGTATLLLYNPEGRVISNSTITGPEVKLPVHQLSNGMYMIKIVTASGTAIRKFIKH